MGRFGLFCVKAVGARDTDVRRRANVSGCCDHPLDLARGQDNYVGPWQVVKAVLLNRWPEVQM
jgi:hypothetical protein